MLCFKVIYLIIKKIIFRQKIVIKNKIDIFVLSTLLPYIFTDRENQRNLNYKFDKKQECTIQVDLEGEGDLSQIGENIMDIKIPKFI